MRVFTEVTEFQNDPQSLPLTYEQRRKHRLVLKGPGEDPLHLLLPRGSRLRRGLHLQAQDGSVLKVELASEELSEVRAEGIDLARACYHLGNRHIPAAITAHSVSYQRDHVIDAMMEGLGFVVTHQSRGFEPEPGAYHGHSHG